MSTNTEDHKFIDAVYNGEYASAKQMFENFDEKTKMKYIEFRDYKQDSLLSIAVRDNPKPTQELKDYLSYFAKAGVTVESDSFSVQPISYVAKHKGMEDVAQDIISKSKQDSALSSNNHTRDALIDAIYSNNIAVAKILIDNDVDLYATRNGLNSFEIAVLNNNAELVHMLIEHDKSHLYINNSDEYASILETAIKLQNPAIVKDLLDNGAYIQGHSYGKHNDAYIDAFRAASQGKTDEQLKTDVIYNLVKDEYIARFNKKYGPDLVPPSEDILLHRQVAFPQVKKADSQALQEGQEINFEFQKAYIGRRMVNEKDQQTMIPDIL